MAQRTLESNSKMKESLKTFRLKQLIAVCVKTEKTPTSTPSFADWIFQLTATYYGIARRSGRGYLQLMLDSWRYDKWNILVKNNPYLLPQEKEEWISKHL